MALTRLIVAATGALSVGLLAASVGWLVAGEHPVQVGSGPAPAAVAKPVTAASAKANGKNRERPVGAARKEDKPLLKFFELRDRAQFVVYAIDCSGSMATRNSLDVAKRELLTSLSQLPADAQFAVIFYALEPHILSDDQGHQGLMAATASNRKRVQSQIAKIEPDGGTDHMTALRASLALKPEVIFLLTDADLMTNGDVNEILAAMGKTPKQGEAAGRDLMTAIRAFMDSFRRPTETRIQVIQLGRGPEVGQQAPLRRLATTTGGTYLYLDVNRFPG